MLDKFPGFLGYGGIIAIHADWPSYPSGIGWEIALQNLGNFPKGTNFFEIDDIDRCKLFITVNPQTLQDCYEYKHYHTAIWHEDLVELKKRGFVTGVYEKSDYEFELIQFEKLKKSFGEHLKTDENGNLIFYIKDKDGELIESKYNKPEPDYEDDDEDFVCRKCAFIPESLSVTTAGFNKLIELSKELQFTEELNLIVNPLIKIKRYDSAVREASLFLETSIKNFHKKNLYGQKLIEFHINDVVTNNDNFFSAAIKCYRGELRTIFKFIRNDFAHNFKVLTEEQCRLILRRINDTYMEFNEVTNVYYNKNNT